MVVFRHNIYTLDVKKLALQLLPVKLRQPRLIALLNALISPIENLYARFINYKKSIEYELTITGQVCYLQKLMNDFFDYSNRRIVIEDVDINEQPALYLKTEGLDKGLITFKEGEASADYFFPTQQEATGEGGYFVVKVPAGLIYNVDKMKALLNKYKLPTTAFNIIEV